MIPDTCSLPPSLVVPKLNTVTVKSSSCQTGQSIQLWSPENKALETYIGQLALLRRTMSARDLLVLGFEVIDGHGSLCDFGPALDRGNPAARLLLRQRRSQVHLDEGRDIRHKRHAGRIAVICSLLSPSSDLVGRIADFGVFGVAESLTAASTWGCPDLALVATGADVA